MGIQGLLGLLEEALHDVHISELRGKRVAVDGYCWLHKATYSCALELCTVGETNQFLGYCEALLDMLKFFDIKPIIVLDGGPLPSKAHQEEIRRRRRDENQKKGRDALAAGNKEVALAHFQRAVDVTPAMAAKFEDLLRKRGVQFIVAPFEADAQLAFLQKTGAVDFVLTEDSDMVPYGVSCIVFKMNKNGQGKILRLDEALKTKAIGGLSQVSLRHACILSGCDYLEGLPGMGLKTAVKTIRRYRDIGRTIRALRIDGQHKVPEGYEEQFLHAELTFCHQQVFDPIKRVAVPLCPLPDDLTWEELEGFLGKCVPESIACDIADGKRDPITRAFFPAFATSPVPAEALKGETLSRSHSAPLFAKNNPKSMKSGSSTDTPKTGILKFFSPITTDLSDSCVSESVERKSSPLPSLSPALKRPFVSPLRSSESSQTKEFGDDDEKSSKRRRISQCFSMKFFGKNLETRSSSFSCTIQGEDSLPEPTESVTESLDFEKDQEQDEYFSDEEQKQEVKNKDKDKECSDSDDDEVDDDCVIGQLSSTTVLREGSFAGRPQTLYRSSFLAHGRLTLPPNQSPVRSSSSSFVSTSLALDSDESSVSEVSEPSLSNSGCERKNSIGPKPPISSDCVNSPCKAKSDSQVSKLTNSPSFLSRFFTPRTSVPYPVSGSQ